MGFHKRKITNWGNYPRVTANVSEPEFADDLQNSVRDVPTVIARGNGRCYGDASLNDNVVSMTKFNKLLDFDDKNGLVTCQAGALLDQVIELVVPRGFFLSVTPGTKFVTVGGAIAADVHGKNHHAEGCFSNYVEWLKLMTAEGTVVTCSRSENSQLFWATVGGMGLTGVITEACFRVKPIESAFIRLESIKTSCLEETMELFDSSQRWTYSVAWIDCFQTGDNRGRSILMRGEHATVSDLTEPQKRSPLSLDKRRSKSVPFDFPGFALNRLSVKAFNTAYYGKQLGRMKRAIVDYDSFFYPLDSIQEWNRIYGKKGFTQYQLALPLDSSRKGLLEILDAIQDSGQGSFLAVLKLFGERNPLAFNSFPIQGYTLALDFKIQKDLPDLIARLDSLVMKFGGRVYLAKDAFSSPGVFSYFRDVKSPKFESNQYRRLFAERYSAAKAG